jgi:hypothetical protein
MKQNRQHIVLAKLLLRLGISDRGVLEKALLMLEEAEEFSKGAKIATALGDETLARIYSFMQNPAKAELSIE